MMSLPMPTLFGRATAIFDAHKTLHKTVAQLYDLCARLMSGRQVAAAELHALVGVFSVQLREHFSSEEEDDYFGTLARSSAEAGELVAVLHVEHADMRDGLDELARLVEGRASSGELAECLNALLDQFNDHEKKESRAMQQYLREGKECRQSPPVPPYSSPP